MTTFKGQLVLALALNVGLKVLTFTLSTLLTRKLLPNQNGVYFTYNVYNDAVLFVAREATRNVASRFSILEEGEEGNDEQATKSTVTASHEGKRVPHHHGGKDATPKKQVDVANVRRMVSIALFSVPLAVVAAFVLELIGICFGRASFFPSMLRHAHTSQQHQQYLHPASTRPSRATGRISSLKGVLDSFPLLPLPYLPELTVVGCAVLMAVVEPCVVIVQSLNLFRVVVLAESAALTARLITVLAVIYTSQRHGRDAVQEDGEPLHSNGLRSLWEARMALAFGQLAYAVTHVVYYAVVVSGLSVARWLGASAELQQVRVACIEGKAALGSGRVGDMGRENTTQRVRPANVPESKSRCAKFCASFVFPWCFYAVLDSFNECRQQAALLFAFLRESLLRLVLSEGESFALTSLGSEAARGYYQLIYSLGSLVARLLFRVWENACFVKWSREASLGHRDAAVQLLKLMLRLSFYVGFSFALLGPPLTKTFLLTMYTSRWATPQVTTALQLSFLGMPLMAWNGLLEAFLRAVASPATLQRLQQWMVGETVVYIAACYVTLIAFGKDDEGGESVSVLVLLNTLNMLWRCGASLYLLVSSPAVSASSFPPAAAAAETLNREPSTPSEVSGGLPGGITSSSSHSGEGSSTVAGNEPIASLHVFVHLFPRRILAGCAVLFVLSRAVTASLLSIALVGLAYGAVILTWDAEVRRLLVTPVWRHITRVLLRHRHRQDAPPVVAATVAEMEKKQQ
jgi:oligosaccharide translocation protein RFT1